MERHPGKSPAARMYGLKYVSFTTSNARSQAVKLARNVLLQDIVQLGYVASMQVTPVVSSPCTL